MEGTDRTADGSQGFSKGVCPSSNRTTASILQNAPLLWRSEAFRKVLEEAERAALASTLVVLYGESGTGKRRIAQHIHEKSSRSRKPLQIWSAPQSQDALLQSLLFGHKKGSFTDAVSEFVGLLPAADGSTILVDDAHVMSLRAQQLLLEFMDDPVVRPIGTTQKTAVDVRIIVATNQDLQALAASGGFLPDLANRFSEGLLIRIPPLRERKEDIRPLAEHLIREYGLLYLKAIPHLAPGALEILERYSWPGNARELAGVLQNAAFRADDSLIGEEEIRRALGERAKGLIATDELASLAALSRAERLSEKVMRRVLVIVSDNGAEAARVLELPERTFRRYLKTYKIAKRMG